jgi:hypothetical protein
VAYPFVPSITFRAFRERLVAEFGCTFHTMGGIPIAGGAIQFLQRRVAGQFLNVVCCVADEADVAPSVLRSVCRALRVDPAEFGFELEDDE